MRGLVVVAAVISLAPACGSLGSSPSSFPPVEDADMVGGEVVLGEGTTAGVRWEFVGYRHRNGVDVCQAFKEIHARGGMSVSAFCGARPDGAPAFICTYSAGGTQSPYVMVEGLAAPDVTGVRVVFADQSARPVDVLAGAEQLGDNAFLLLVPLPSEEPIIDSDAALAAVGGEIVGVEATDASGVTSPPGAIGHVSMGCVRSSAVSMSPRGTRGETSDIAAAARPAVPASTGA